MAGVPKMTDRQTFFNILFSLMMRMCVLCVRRYECLLGSLCIARMASSLFFHASYRIINCDVQNIVAHAEIIMQPHQTLNIQKMYESMAMECTYQKNMFPGLIYRSKDAPVVLLCFYSGKVVLTGGKTVRDIEYGWNMLWKVVRKFVQ